MKPTLPEPSLDGPTATYRNVLPDVDLAVTADYYGFRQVLIVHSAQAAKNPKLRELQFDSHTKNASVRLAPGKGGGQESPSAVRKAVVPADGLEVVGKDGVVVFRGDASQMWDSSGRAGRGTPPTVAADGSRHAQMDVSVSRDSLSITPDADFLTAPTTQYPVFIDPTYNWAGRKNHHAVVQSAWPTAKNYDRTGGDFNDLKAGRAIEGGDNFVSRSYVEMNISSVAGRYIKSATLRTKVLHSWSCSGGPTAAWWTYSIDSNTTWSDQPSAIEKMSTRSVSNHAAYCPGSGGADFPVTSAVRDYANSEYSRITFMLRADDESTVDDWRRYSLESQNLSLEVEYNSYPYLPGALEAKDLSKTIPCESGSGRPYLAKTSEFKLRAKISDPDPGQLRADYQLYKGTAGDPAGSPYEKSQPDVVNGAMSEVEVSSAAMTSDGIYHWRVRASDGDLYSPWSSRCEFTLDTTKPAAASVSSADYPFESGAGGVGGAGVTGSFTLSASGTTDVAYYKYCFTEWGCSDAPTKKATPSSLGGNAIIKFTPTLEGTQALSVSSVDRAGNESAIYRHKFQVATHEPLVNELQGHWRLNGSFVDESPKGRNLTPWEGASATAEGYTGQSLDLDGVANRAFISSPLVTTNQSYTVATWVKLGSKNSAAHQTVIGQDGTRTSAFRLTRNKDTDRWQFRLAASNTDDTAVLGPQSANATQVGVWTHLTGVYDAATKKARLYVNGVLEDEVSYTTAWNSSGTFVLGRGLWNGQQGFFFHGTIDETRAYQRVLVPSEVALLANQPVLRAHYELNEGSGSTVKDSVTGREGQISGGAEWITDGDQTALRFVEGSGVTAPNPRVRTDRSYTVAAWVRVKNPDQYSRSAVSFKGQSFSPGMLGRRVNAEGIGKWGLLVSCSSTQSCGTSAVSAGSAQSENWVHLTGVYDAVAKQSKLYVNGIFVGYASNVTSWNSAGELLLGHAVWNGSATDWWHGDIDDVKVFAGIPKDEQIEELAVR